MVTSQLNCWVGRAERQESNVPPARLLVPG